ncbi:MAG TPA: glycerol-3-phosphate 1-O-acyltransferase PlsY [Bacillota bacterium]|nr:glycerol-3-phosphate 1-O-acyltransferase PlsY [Bacillota bacterium]HPZ53603.1 glycerol-3-phosphate 1-O-acyltransferase PlsY [Bacillota bacterium]HQD17164.1 glycerol-3-phosphate 1-O-acyltransferase PlsY [Bacillota bacterium]
MDSAAVYWRKVVGARRSTFFMRPSACFTRTVEESEIVDHFRVVLALAIGYFIGSIPFGVLIGQQAAGVDVRRLGSGNIGATNVLRVLGPRIAAVVLATDVAKGMVAVLIGKWLVGGETVPLIAGLAAVVGHNWSVFLRLGGGKGVATTVGVVIATMPLVAAIAILAFAVVVGITRYVSLGSLVLACTLPIAAWLSDRPVLHTVFALILGLMVIWRHRSNIVRLIEGRENKLGKRVR